MRAAARPPTDQVPGTEWLTRSGGAFLYLFSSDYPHVEGGRDPIGKFERAVENQPEEIKTQFFSENFLRVWPEARVEI